MRRLPLTLLLALALFIPGCGIIIGQIMTLGTGVEELKALKGDISTIRPGAKVAIIAPFTKKGTGFHVCRGDDAARFADAWSYAGLFEAQMRFDDSFVELNTLETLKQKTPSDLTNMLALPFTPEYLVFGTITHRDTIVAPTKGVMMDVAWELEFFDLASKTSTVVYIKAEDIYSDLAATVTEELGEALRQTKR